MENLLKVRIHHVARTDFDGFKKMTDAVGGVRVYAEEASDGTGNGGPVVIQKGWNDLNGERGPRPSSVSATRSARVTSPAAGASWPSSRPCSSRPPARETITNPLKVARFADAATENLVVDQDLGIGAMRDYALSLRDIRGGDVVFATAPFSGFGTTSGGASIDIVDKAAMAELGEALRTDTMDEYLDVFVTP